MHTRRALVFLALTPLILTAVTATAVPAQAAKKKGAAFCVMGDCGNNDRTREFDKTSSGLISAMAYRPELMDLDYLQYFLGRPTNLEAMAGRPNKEYHWLDDQRHLQYELQTTEVAGRITESTFTAHLPSHDLTFEDVEKQFGKDSKHFFDSEAHPTKLYSVSPNTFLTFSSAPHSFRVTRARVLYKGPGLARAPQQDILAAQQQHQWRMEPVLYGNNYAQALPLIQARLKTNPGDPQAHFLLARALSKTNHLNEAIHEYKYALANCGGNDGLRQQCEEALTEYQVLRSGAPVQRKTVIMHGGQRIMSKGVDDTRSIDPSLGAVPFQGNNY